MTEHDRPTGRERQLITAACMMAQFMAAVEATIVGAAMPTISGALGGFELFPWVFSAYMLAQAAATPIYGKLADIYGRKRVFFLGTMLFLLGSLACGLAWGMLPLVIFRAIQGLGAGAVQPVAYTIMADIYDPAARAKMQGWLSAVWASSAIFGPLLGAFLVQHWHWAAVFWINVPVGIAAICIMWVHLSESISRRVRRVDWVGAGLLVIGVVTLMLALIQGRTMAGPVVLALVVVGTAALAALVWHELHTPEPILPFVLWRHRILAVGNAATLLVGMFIIINVVFVPTFIQGGMGQSVTTAGIAIGCSSIGWTVASLVSGRLMVRTSYRLTGLIGGFGGCLAVLVLTMLRSDSWVGFAILGNLAVGCAMGFANTTFSISVQTAVEWEQRGAVTAANMFMRTLGQAIGAGLFGAILTWWVASAGPHAAAQVNQLLEPGGRASMSAADIAHLSAAIGGGIHDIYRVAFVLALCILGLAWMIPARLNPARQAARPAAAE